MYKRILVPYDGSEPAQHALAAAVDMAKETEGSAITVLNVSEMPSSIDPSFKAAQQVIGVAETGVLENQSLQSKFYASQFEDIKKSVDAIVGDFDAVTLRIESGRPLSVINAFVDTGNYDLIVMGCRGLGGIRGTIGSVSYAVLRACSLPVLVIR